MRVEGGTIRDALATVTAIAPGAGMEADARAVRILQSLPPARRPAWVRMGHRLARGMPARHAGFLLCREWGATVWEARERADAVQRRLGAGTT